MSQALRFIGGQCRDRPGGEAQAQAMLLLGLDYARKLRAIDPERLDGWKQAGLIEYDPRRHPDRGGDPSVPAARSTPSSTSRRPGRPTT